MERIQTGLQSLVKASKNEPWKITFISPADSIERTALIGKGGDVEVGPRLREVLTSIERYQAYPRTITGRELDLLGMTTADSFVVQMAKDNPVHIEISFKFYRQYLNPANQKPKGYHGVPEEAPSMSIQAIAREETGSSSIGSKLNRYEKSSEEVASPLQDGEVVEVNYVNSASNQIDFMEAYDDRYDELFPNELDHQVRIGDVMMVIPPLSIEVNRVSSIRKIKTLRSKSSMLIKAGSSATTLTMQLYFHDLDAINGKKVKMHKKLDRNYYMDGLRPLIAQFRKAPFVPIDNVYINETLGISSVALINLSLQTVPGFPHSMSATLTLAQFDHQAFMPQVTYLGDAMNYPMFRWYYQEPLRDDIAVEDRSPYRTYFEKIPDSGLTNDFTFSIAEEQYLIERKEAIQNLRYLTNPILAKEKFYNPSEAKGDTVDDNTMLGRLYKDGVMADKVLGQYDRYMILKNSGELKEPESLGESIADGINDKAYKKVYGDDYDMNKIYKVSHYAGANSPLFNQVAPNISVDQNGAFKLRLYDQTNINMFDSDYVQGTKSGLTTLVVPGTEIEKVRKILAKGKSAEVDFISGLDAWEAAKTAIEQTEGEIPLVDYTITGTLIPTAVTVMYENQFSNIQLQALEAPSFQFLGGQDPYIQVSFEADDTAVEELQDLMRTAEEYSRKYRTGITSGFLGVTNHLVQLFGVSTVMVEAMGIRTMSGFPGRYQIDMTLCGFNKTQKRNEQLEGISPIYGEKVTKESREAGNYIPGSDEAIIELKMKDLELYPDLELPTYDELVSALPYIGANCDVYENRTGGKYVDPDFYMATPETMREFLRNELDTGTQDLSISDNMGVQLTTSSTGVDMLEGDASMWDILNAADSRIGGIGAGLSWSGAMDEEDGGSSNSEGVSFHSEEIKAYATNPKEYRKPPSFAEWKSWGLGTDERAYSAWKENPNPEEWRVYNRIYELLDQYWTNAGLVYNDKNESESNTVWRNVAYSSVEDMTDVSWNRVIDQNKDLLKEGRKKKRKLDNIATSDFRGMSWKIPRERVANYIKALLTVTSKWKQTSDSGVPKVDKQGNVAGIAGVPISSEATHLDNAKRLVWDWKYNLEIGMQKMIDTYKKALDKKDDAEYLHRPWDWMVSGYGVGNIEGKLENAFYQKVISVFKSKYNGYDKMYASPTAQNNLVIMQQRNGYTGREMEIIQGKKSTLIEELVDNGYRIKKKDNLIFKDEYYSKKETKEKLEAKTQGEVIEIYNKWAKEKFSAEDDWLKASGTEASMAAATSASYEAQGNREANPEAAANYENLADVEDYNAEVAANRLLAQRDPQEVFPEMYKDVLDYDQKMRLIRAFPTFQMFIVDEGRWMSNYRLWDNLYGFNAIQSIDVHKSRKIAADTAVIRMTNVYSNLTARSIDTTYEEWDYKFWDNLVFGNPNEELLEARKELLSSMLLQTGARIHLRMGYGSDPTKLPVMFNGTITELNAEEEVEIVAQGDGVELGNAISGDKEEKNKSLFRVKEPRDFLCELMTSKGNWFKDAINYSTDGNWFQENPLGIMHFGQPGSKVPEGTWKFWDLDKDWGETCQNIYSSNGLATYSQFTMPDGNSIPFSFEDTPIMRWLQPGDEDNILINLYQNTVWDIAQILAYCSPDYIATVHPFEMRSTLFFGKPYWSMAYTYDSSYEYSAEQKSWTRNRKMEHRKPYSQIHMLDSYMDIISNGIKASEDGIYTNVIVSYDGKQTPVLQADWDIRFDKQKTVVLEADLVARMPLVNFYKTEAQAMNYGMSAVRDYMKDMYKGELVSIGDPTIKPHDLCYMHDTMYDMNGNFQVKAVTHQFSQETGYITSIQPDVVAVTDDIAMVSLANWSSALGAKLAAYGIGTATAAYALRKVMRSSISKKSIELGKKGAPKATQQAVRLMASFLPSDDADVQAYKKTLKELTKLSLDDPNREAKLKELDDKVSKLEGKVNKWKEDGVFENAKGKNVKGIKGKMATRANLSAIKNATAALKDGSKAFPKIAKAATIVRAANPVALIASTAASWAVDTILEKYRRKKAAMQCVLIQPLTYQGRQYTAGINGHKGMVVGDSPGRLDSFMMGAGFDGKDDGGIQEWVMDMFNDLAGDHKDFAISQEELANKNWTNE